MHRNPEVCERDRISKVYSDRDSAGRGGLYAWHRPEVRQQDAARNLAISRLLGEAFGGDLSQIDVLDIGCGTGAFLRTLTEWGAGPYRLTGTEFLPDRLEIARQISAPEIKWHLGDCSFANNENFHLISTNTVFSSILDEESRVSLANKMWNLLKPGGWLMVFDFRYNNPSNLNVRKVTHSSLCSYWPNAINAHYQSLLLAPPIARLVVPRSYFMGELLSYFPLLRSHFVYFAQKSTT